MLIETRNRKRESEARKILLEDCTAIDARITQTDQEIVVLEQRVVKQRLDLQRLALIIKTQGVIMTYWNRR